MNEDHGERIAALEQRMKHAEIQGAQNTETLMEIRDILMQAKGAKWFIVGMVGVGGFLAGLSHKLMPFLQR